MKAISPNMGNINFCSAGQRTGGVISDAGGQTVDVTAGTGYLKAIDNDTAEDIMVRCFAKTILVGWDSLIDCDTKEEFEYSVANAESLLRDDKDFYSEARKFSENIDNYINSTGDKLTEK